MHETKFVNEILNILENNLDKGILLRNTVVNIRLSPFSHVTSERLQETFKEFSKETDFKEVKLNIIPLEVTVYCKNCKSISKVSKVALNCVYCGGLDLDIQIEREFFVESIELEDKEQGLND